MSVTSRSGSAGSRARAPIRPYIAALSAAIVRTASSPWRARNIWLTNSCGIVDVPAGDLLLELPHLAGERLDVGLLMTRQSRHDGVRQLMRSGQRDVPVLDPLEHFPRLARCNFRVDERVERPVHGDHVVRADELVELDVVHVPASAMLGSVQDEEDVVGIDMHLGNPIAADAVAHGDRMKPEHVGKHSLGRRVAGRDVHPHNASRVLQQRRQLSGRALLDPGSGDHPHVHRTTSPARAAAPSRHDGRESRTPATSHRRTDGTCSLWVGEPVATEERSCRRGQVPSVVFRGERSTSCGADRPRADRALSRLLPLDLRRLRGVGPW